MCTLIGKTMNGCSTLSEKCADKAKDSKIVRRMVQNIKIVLYRVSLNGDTFYTCKRDFAKFMAKFFGACYNKEIRNVEESNDVLKRIALLKDNVLCCGGGDIMFSNKIEIIIK